MITWYRRLNTNPYLYRRLGLVVRGLGSMHEVRGPRLKLCCIHCTPQKIVHILINENSFIRSSVYSSV
jgi:hypothetical protein